MVLLKQHKIRNRCIKCPGMLTPGSIGDLTFMHLWQHHNWACISAARSLNTASHITAPLFQKLREAEKNSPVKYHGSLKRYHHKTTQSGFRLAWYLRNTTVSTLFPAQLPLTDTRTLHTVARNNCTPKSRCSGVRTIHRHSDNQLLATVRLGQCDKGAKCWQLSIMPRCGQIIQAAN